MKYIIYAFTKSDDCGDVYVFNGTEQEMMERVRAMALDIASNLEYYECESISYGWDKYSYPTYHAIVHTDDSNIVIEAREWQYVKPMKINRKSLYKAKKLEESGWTNIEEDD